MATKLGRKEIPGDVKSFVYVGRPANAQGDFGPGVGLADCNCVNQFGEANNSKYYHGGVVKSQAGKFYVYLEWGRNFSGKSWDMGGFRGQDFQFVDCSSEADARDFFKKQMESKNTKRLIQQTIGGNTVWTAKPGDDGYFVQSLATRERGLPDAYNIKDSSGVVKTAPTSPVATKTASSPSRQHHPAVEALARALVGGVQSYTRSVSQATGIVPTMGTITEVRDILVPTAMGRVSQIGTDLKVLLGDQNLRDISRAVYSMIPRYIPRGGLTEDQAILSPSNVTSLLQDLDTFEAALKAEDFDATTVTNGYDVDQVLNAQLELLDPSSALGRWVYQTLSAQTNNRHGYLSGPIKVKNVFKITRQDRDDQFMKNVRTVAGQRRGQFTLRANLQPKTRDDLTADETRLYADANVVLTQHGTRSVNIHPIMSTHFRMPKNLSGVPIAGANFGHGTYTATDFKKAVGYTSHSRGAWSSGSGGIQGRGAFMFMCDTLMGTAYRAPSTGSWMTPPSGADSVFGVGGDRGHRLENDEHVVFSPHYNRIRYLVEFTF